MAGYVIPINHDIASPYCFPHSLLNPYFAIQTQYQLSVRILIHVTPVLSVCAAEPVWGAAGGEEAGASGHSGVVCHLAHTFQLSQNLSSSKFSSLIVNTAPH